VAILSSGWPTPTTTAMENEGFTDISTVYWSLSSVSNSSSNSTGDDDYYYYLESSHQATDVLVFIGLMCLLVLMGCYLFMLWDAHEHNEFVYKHLDKNEATSNAHAERVAAGNDSRAFRNNKKVSIWTSLYSCCCGSKSKKQQNQQNHRRPMTSEFRNELSDNWSFEDLWRTNIIGDDRIEEDDNIDIDDKQVVGRKVVVKYINAAIPAQLIDKEGNRLFRFLFMLFTQHPYWSMFFHQSPMLSRAMRWLGMWRNILVVIFVDTLFMFAVYPDDKTCPHYTTPASCTSLKSKIYMHQSVCVWNATTGTCRLIPPPETFTFVVVVTLFCLVISMPINAFLSFLMDDYAARRPRLSQLWLNENSWLGSTYRSMLMGNVHHEAAITRWNKSEEMKLSDEEIRQAAKLVYQSHASDEEELTFLLAKIRTFFCNPSSDKQVTAEAISRSLNILPTGEAGPLTTLQFLRFGSAYRRLLHQLRSVRKQENNLVRNFLGCESHHRDLMLLQAFILEQVSFFKRFELRKFLTVRDPITAPEVNVWLWLAVWIFLALLFGFFLYWELSWALSIGRSTLDLWGYVFGIALLQDIFLCQTFKIFMTHMFAIELSRKQLQKIYRTLVRAALGTGCSNMDNQLNIVQVLSPACRAARSNDAFRLPSSYILRKVTDVDVVNCQEYRNQGSALNFLVLIPAYLSNSLEFELSDKLFELILSGILTGVLVAFKMIHFAGGPVLVAVPFMVLVVLSLRYMYFRYVQQVRVSKFLKEKRDRHRLKLFSQQYHLWMTNKSKRLKFQSNASGFSGPWVKTIHHLYDIMATLWRGKYRSRSRKITKRLILQWKRMNCQFGAGMEPWSRHDHRTYRHNQLTIPSEIYSMIPVTEVGERYPSFHSELNKRLFDSVQLTLIDHEHPHSLLGAHGDHSVGDRGEHRLRIKDSHDEYSGHDDTIDNDENDGLSSHSSGSSSSFYVEYAPRELFVASPSDSYEYQMAFKPSSTLNEIRMKSPIIDEPGALNFVFNVCLRGNRNQIRNHMIKITELGQAERGDSYSYLLWFKFAQANDKRVRKQILKETLSHLWKVYIPLGMQPLSRQEMRELEEDFNVQWDRDEYDDGYIMLTEFVDWFIAVLDWISRQREGMLPRNNQYYFHYS
jgi:hypothetical protein